MREEREGGGLALQEVLSHFGRRPAEVLAASQRFIRNWGVGTGHRADLYHVVDQRYLGSETFVEEVAERVRHPYP